MKEEAHYSHLHTFCKLNINIIPKMPNSTATYNAKTKKGLYTTVQKNIRKYFYL